MSLLHRALDRLRRALVRWASGSPLRSSVYYAFFSRAFGREHEAVLRGCSSHAGGRAPGSDAYALRRCIHRVEKGLAMRPRREVFALGYIADAVAALESVSARRLPDGGAGDPDELAWAWDVLDLYFRSVGKHPRIEEAERRFRRLPSAGRREGTIKVPAARGGDVAAGPGVDALLALARHRKSVRWFLKKPVPREMIDKAVEVASFSPSACNRQPFMFRVFDDPEWAKRVASVPMGTSGYADNVPVIVVLVGELRAFAEERDRHLIYIDGALAAMAFVHAVEAQGLSSCCINWPELPDKQAEMARLLGLEPDEQIVLLIAVGYADPEGMVCCSQKKPVDRLRRFNFE